MKFDRVLVFLCAGMLLLSASLRAQDYAASVKLSTLGVHIEAYRSFGSSLNARLGYSFINYNYHGSEKATEDYKIDANLKLASASILGDYFPFQSTSLRLTAGMIVNLNKPVVTAIPTKVITIGGDVYNAANLGNIGIDLSFNKVAPYIGIGIGNPTAGDRGFGFVMDIGTYYQGAPKVAMSATGLLEPSASPEQEAVVEHNLNWFKFYPVLSLGLSYKF